MTNIQQSPEDIIKELTPLEKRILIIFGSLHISVNKNVSEHSIKKKLSNKDQKDFSKAIKHLKAMGLIGKYRKENLCMGKEGRIVAETIFKEKRKNSYKELHKIYFLI